MPELCKLKTNAKKETQENKIEKYLVLKLSLLKAAFLGPLCDKKKHLGARRSARECHTAYSVNSLIYKSLFNLC